MYYGAGPSSLIENIALRLGKVPIPVLDALMPLIKARSIHAGVELGIFEALRDGALPAADVAARQNLDREATELLLRTLVACEYLEQRGDSYRLKAATRRTLLRGAAHELCAFTLWCGQLWGAIARLEELLRTGEGFDLHGTLEDPAAWSLYQRAMLEIARFHARTLARHIPVKKGARRLLDIAGSHGLFAAELVRRHPRLQAVVLELPGALEAARALAREEGIAELVEHRAGDLRRDDFACDDFSRGELDVVLLANILHHFKPEENIELLRRVHRALASGGQVAIWDIDLPPTGSKAEIGDLAALFFRLTSNAGAFRATECADWLRGLGFARVRRKRILTLPGYVLVSGSK